MKLQQPKLPAILWYTGDWLKDPAVTLCSPATRGIWFDLLNAMHELGRVGKLCGSVEQLARIARCLPAECSQALSDIQLAGVADVTERNGLYTVINRRMHREHLARKNGAIRQSRFRCNGKSDGPVTPPLEDESDIERHSSGNGGPGERGDPPPPLLPEIAVELPRRPVAIPENSGHIFTILRGEISKAYQRSPVAHWPYEEERLLAELTRVPGAEKEWLEILAYHRKDPRYKRQTVLSLLQNWSGELDKARAFDAAKAAAEGKKLRDPGVPTVQQVKDYTRDKAEGDQRAPGWAVSFHGYWSDTKRDWKRNGKTIDWQIELANQILKWRTQ